MATFVTYFVKLDTFLDAATNSRSDNMLRKK